MYRLLLLLLVSIIPLTAQSRRDITFTARIGWNEKAVALSDREKEEGLSLKFYLDWIEPGTPRAELQSVGKTIGPGTVRLKFVLKPIRSPPC